MPDNCQICGRTQEELDEEFKEDYDITKKEGESVARCGKCRQEYQNGAGNENTEESSQRDQPSNKSWKDEVVA